MNKKKVFIIMLTSILVFCYAATSAWAGPKQRYRWEGVAIGVGAAIVGSTLINHYGCSSYYGPPLAFSFYYSDYDRPSGHHHAYRRSHHSCRRGHWKSHNPNRHRH